MWHRNREYCVLGDFRQRKKLSQRLSKQRVLAAARAALKRPLLRLNDERPTIGEDRSHITSAGHRVHLNSEVRRWVQIAALPALPPCVRRPAKTAEKIHHVEVADRANLHLGPVNPDVHVRRRPARCDEIHRQPQAHLGF